MEDIRMCPKHGFYRGETCKNCGYRGEVVLEKEKVEKLGRFISGLLRHYPERYSLEMDENGWVSFGSLVKAVKRRFKWANQWLVKAIVYSDEKGRYELVDDKIRARYGHSVDVKLEDMPEAEEETLYYGTSEEEASRVMEVGIKPVNRRYVHLSTTLEKGEEVARLRTDEPIVIVIDAKEAKKSGIRFIKVNENIVLAEEIPPKFIKDVVRV